MKKAGKGLERLRANQERLQCFLNAAASRQPPQIGLPEPKSTAVRSGGPFLSQVVSTNDSTFVTVLA